MAGRFELFVDAQSKFRFRLLDGRGLELAVSSGFDDKLAAVAGIDAVRECAGTGLVADLSDKTPGRTRTPHTPRTRLPRTTDRPRIQNKLGTTG